jgi:broad specificity phosphatase PhoE
MPPWRHASRCQRAAVRCWSATALRWAVWSAPFSGLPAWAERRLRLRNCSVSRVDYQESLWLAPGWVVETAGDVSHLDVPALDELQR